MSLIHVWIALRHLDLATATSPTNFPNINQRTPFQLLIVQGFHYSHQLSLFLVAALRSFRHSLPLLLLLSKKTVLPQVVVSSTAPARRWIYPICGWPKMIYACQMLSKHTDQEIGLKLRQLLEFLERIPNVVWSVSQMIFLEDSVLYFHRKSLQRVAQDSKRLLMQQLLIVVAVTLQLTLGRDDLQSYPSMGGYILR